MALPISDFRLLIIVTTIAPVLFASGLERVESRAPFEIRTLSSRADLVSGGDTLIAVKLPPGTKADQLTVTLNGKDMMPRLSLDTASGEYRGRSEERRVGKERKNGEELVELTSKERAHNG